MTYRFGPFELDADGYRLTREGEVVQAEPRVLELLSYLVAHRGSLVDKQELVREVWGSAFVSDASIARAVSEVRAALGDTGEAQRWIATVYGRGYRFVADVEEVALVGDPAPADPQAGVSPPVAERTRSRERLAWVLVGIAGLTAAAFATWFLLKRAAPEEAPKPFWAELNAPEGATIAWVGDGGMAVSPDGARIALVALGPRGKRLVVRDLESGEANTLQGTEGAMFPFWSPDDRWIGFFADGKVKKVPADGGPVQSLADAPHGRGGTWSIEGFIVYAPDIHGSLVRIPDSGGDPSKVTELAAEGQGHRFPHLLPGGRHVVFDASLGGPIAVSSVERPGERRLLVARGANPQYANGFLFWVREGTLIAQPFDAASLQLSGSSTPIARNLERGRGLGNFSVSAAGTLAWREERPELRQLVRFDREGRQVAAYGEPGLLWTFDFSPDGRQALVARGRVEESRLGWDLWVMDLDRRQTTRVTFSHATGISGALSPDGERIAVSIWNPQWSLPASWLRNRDSAYRSDAGGELWLQSVSGAGGQQHLLDTAQIHYVREWAPDGENLLSRVQYPGTSLDIVHFTVDEPEALTPFLATPYEESGPRLAPDGEWIAYASDESGQWEVYVSDFPARRRRWKISKGDLIVPGGQPILEWGLEGSAVYYGTETGLVKVPVTRRAEQLELGAIETIGIDSSRLGPSRFLIDGDTILAPAVAEDSSEQPIRIVRHWKGLLGVLD